VIATVFRNRDGRFDIALLHHVSRPQKSRKLSGLARLEMILQFQGDDRVKAAEFAASNEDQCVIGKRHAC
jgi:hypothetical protein